MKHNLLSRVLGMLLVLTMLVGMIPATSLTAFAAAGGVVYVGGVGMNDGDYLAVGATATQTTKPSGGYAYYKNGTLTLDNYRYIGIGHSYLDDGITYRAIIYASNDIQIELVGTNTLTQQSDINTACIWGGANVSLTGEGTLSLLYALWGIICKSDLSIESVNLTVFSCNFGIYSANQEVIINGGSFKIDAIDGAVYGRRGIEINGGSGIFQKSWDSVYRVLDSQIGTVTIDPSLNAMASTVNGELGEYVAANLASYTKIVIERAAINNVSVSATFSGTPANATSNTDGITVTGTQWYRQNGSTWTALTSSDTIKEGYTYRCEVTVAATNGYTLADGYTVKINGTAATKKSGNTWYRDVTITGYTRYVDVYDIALPEAFTNPDFTYNDEEGAAYHWDVVQVEWFECDKDDYILSGALTENDVFKKDTYYRVEVTVVPETAWQFDGSDFSFFINDKLAMPLYGYNKEYPGGVTGYVVYNTADIEGDYELFVYDDSLSGSAKNIYIKDGQYLGSNATGATATKPASGGYAYYKDGVLELNGYKNEKAHFIFEELALELYLVGDNTIGAIYDNEWGMAGGNLETRQGNLVIDAADGGKLTIASNPLDAYCNIQVKDLYFNGGELTSCLANGTYGAAVQLNDGNLYLENGYEAYVSDTNDFASATKWDGTTDISKYDCVWMRSAPGVYVGGIAMYDGDYLAVGATTTQTTKPSGGYAYYKNGKLTLNNYSYEGKGYQYDSLGYYATVHTEQDLTLELVGTNTLKQTAGDSDTICINSGSLTITGDGSLTYSDNGYGIFADKTITINGGSITTNDDGYNGLRSKLGDIIINGGNVTAFGDIALRAVSGSVKINGGTVTVTGITRAIDYSISGSFTVAEGLHIQASTTVDGELGEYVAENHSRYKKIVVRPGPSDTGVNVSGTVTSFNSNTDEITVALYKEGSASADYTATVKGNSAGYTLSGVAAGTYTMKVSKNNHVTREYELTVGTGNVTLDVKIHLKGDINGDGRVNTTDVGRANAHAKKTNLLSGYELSCADVSGDGKVNTTDVGRMNAHAKKTNLMW